RRATLVAAARRGFAEEDAEGLTGRPVGEIADVDDLAGLLGRCREADIEIDLVTPRLALRLDRQGIPDDARRLRIIEPRGSRDRPRRDPYRTLHLCHTRLRERGKSRRGVAGRPLALVPASALMRSARLMIPTVIPPRHDLFYRHHWLRWYSSSAASRAARSG